jgi:hypothetical protein
MALKELEVISINKCARVIQKLSNKMKQGTEKRKLCSSGPKIKKIVACLSRFNALMKVHCGYYYTTS